MAKPKFRHGRIARDARGASIVVLTVFVTTVLAAASASEARPAGTGVPPAGTGMGTPAAMKDPRCNTKQGTPPYGIWDFVISGSGPVCVTPWKGGADNGGTTATGVTASTITVAALTPNAAQIAQQKQQGGTPPKNEATGTLGEMSDALSDYLAAYAHTYETYGRHVKLQFVESTGSDEASQRADAITV